MIHAQDAQGHCIGHRLSGKATVSLPQAELCVLRAVPHLIALLHVGSTEESESFSPLLERRLQICPLLRMYYCYMKN